MIGYKILRNEKLDIDVVENPEGLPFIDIICRSEPTGKITGWISLNKEQAEEVIRELQKKLVKL